MVGVEGFGAVLLEDLGGVGGCWGGVRGEGQRGRHEDVLVSDLYFSERRRTSSMFSRPRAFWIMMISPCVSLGLRGTRRRRKRTSSSKGYPRSMIALLLTNLAGILVLPRFGNSLVLVLTLAASLLELL